MIQKSPDQFPTNEKYQTVEDAVRGLILEQDRTGVVDYLKANPAMVGEFCMTVMDRFPKEDRHSPALHISFVLEEALGIEKPNI